MSARLVRFWLALAVLLAPSVAAAQDDGARVYQPAPVGAQSLTTFVVVKRGDEGPEPGQVTPGVETATDIFVMRWARTYDLAGRQFTPFVIVPTGRIRVTDGGPASESSGLGDLQLGATLGLLGTPAMDAEAFAAYRPDVSMSLFGRVWLPTGAYDPGQPVNFGTHRIAGQLGLATTVVMGQSYRDEHLTALELLPTITFYADNDNPFGGDERSQDPLFSLEAHLTHNLSRRIWISADLLYRQGGVSSLDGFDNDDETHGLSMGASLVVPLTSRAVVAFTYEHSVQRWDDGPEGWFFRTAVVVPFQAQSGRRAN